MKKTLVFIDFDSVNHTVGSFGNSLENLRFFEDIRHFIKGQGYDVLESKIYANFDSEDLKNVNYQTVLQELGHSTKHAPGHMKKTSNTLLAVELLTELFENNDIETFIIFSNDESFIPLLKKIRSKGKEVLLFCADSNLNDSLSLNTSKVLYYEEIFELSYDDFKSNVIEKAESIDLDYVSAEDIEKAKKVSNILLSSKIYLETTRKGEHIFLTGYSFAISAVTKKTSYENIRLFILAHALGYLTLYVADKENGYIGIKK